MKTIILFAIFILPSFGGVGGGLYAQIVNIPDPVFKQRLIDEGVDTNFDGEIQVSEAEAVTGMLDVNGQFDDIYDLTGIEAFVNITGLDVWHNQLTTLDLSNNTALVELNCIDNNLTYLNVENCVNLEKISAYHNQLPDVNLTSNVQLKDVRLNKNNLISLDIRNNNNSNITNFNSRDNPSLTCIFVDDMEYSENSPVWFKDPASTYVETQGECDALGIYDSTIFEDLLIYPNPVKNILYLKMPEIHNNIEIDIVDIKGNEIIKYQINNTEYKIDISHLHSGIYFVILKDLQTKETPIVIGTKKLIKL